VFYDRFLELCKIKNEKPSPLLESLGITRGVLHKWRNGSTVNSNILCKIADYFDVSVDYLLGRTDKPEINR
jgi:transcriptional regulator with XRE-family HTH domain